MLMCLMIPEVSENFAFRHPERVLVPNRTNPSLHLRYAYTYALRLQSSFFSPFQEQRSTVEVCVQSCQDSQLCFRPFLAGLQFAIAEYVKEVKIIMHHLL